MTVTDRSAARSGRYRQREEMLRTFTAHVQDLAQDRAARARLRPAARYPMEDPRSESAVGEFFHWLHVRAGDPETARNRNVRRAMFLTAGLIAQNPDARTLEDRWREHVRAAQCAEEPPRGLHLDLGLALAELERRRNEAGGGQQESSGEGRMTPLRRRLVQAVRAEPEDLPLLMSRMIAYLHSQQAHLPAWWTLASDLVQHAYEPGAVGMRWQESFLRLPEWRRSGRASGSGKP